ncbi:AAA family ATPase, partial [Leuconostoc mesenteroides]
MSSEEYIQSVESSINNYLIQLQSDIARLEYLKIIQDRNVVIVGGNGVGKSSFASYLKDALTDNIIMIPAQKYLYTDFNDAYNFYTAGQSDINIIQKEDMARNAKISNDLNDYNRKNTKIFAELITVLVNEHVLITNAYFGPEKDLTTQLTTLKNVWSIMFPNIELIEDPIKRILNVKKDNDIYSVNSLSDGEKAVLYYMLQILFVPKESFVFIDEPETYLNSTISDRLW